MDYVKFIDGHSIWTGDYIRNETCLYMATPFNVG